MPNIQAVLKSEIARVARKELRGETEHLKKLTSHYRGEIAALKRRLLALERQLARVGKAGARGAGRAAAAPDDGEGDGTRLRYSAKGLAAQRKRLGISAAAMAQLLGVSAQSIYKWEDGKTRPRASQIKAIAALRGIGKREAMARLGQAGAETAAE